MKKSILSVMILCIANGVFAQVDERVRLGVTVSGKFLATDDDVTDEFTYSVRNIIMDRNGDMKFWDEYNNLKSTNGYFSYFIGGEDADERSGNFSDVEFTGGESFSLSLSYKYDLSSGETKTGQFDYDYEPSDILNAYNAEHSFDAEFAFNAENAIRAANAENALSAQKADTASIAIKAWYADSSMTALNALQADLALDAEKWNGRGTDFLDVDLTTDVDEKTLALGSQRFLVDDDEIGGFKGLRMNSLLLIVPKPFANSEELSPVNLLFPRMWDLPRNVTYLLGLCSEGFEVNSFLTANIPTLHPLIDNALRINIEDPDEETSGKSTFALSANNDNGTGGAFFSGGNVGTLARGNSGHVGFASNENATGAGIFGVVLQKPAGDNVTYGVLGNANDLTSECGVYALAAFGDFLLSGMQLSLSDDRLKKSIKDLDNSLEKVIQLRPTQYQYKTDTPYNLAKGNQSGFMAQEMEEVFPQLVHSVRLPESLDTYEMAQSNTEEYKAIDYNSLIPILTKAIQELNEKVEAQEKLINELNNELSKK